MGLLTVGHPLSWSDSEKHREYVRKHGIQQFIHTYNNLKDRNNDCLKWGDEVEYMLVTRNDEEKKVRLSLRAYDILQDLMKEELEHPEKPQDALWRPEYGRFMLEGTPGTPYGGVLCCVTKSERSMKQRRDLAKQRLQSNESLLTLTMFPLMGMLDENGKAAFVEPLHVDGETEEQRNKQLQVNGAVAKSPFIPDAIINPHPRFGTLTANIRERRGDNVNILVPLFMDRNTNIEAINNIVLDANNKPQIHMDAMAFGMGCCCLQCTFQAPNIHEARLLYDNFAVLCPVMLALTAATPIVRGLLADTEVRWSIVSASVDDRKPEERTVIPKSRYASISCYIAETEEAEKYSDLHLLQNKEAYATLREAGIDELLARHVAHLFIRDPLVIFSERIELDDTQETDHFENIQSTNWQTVRFKPPPPNSQIGWRVEFRVMEAQISDFENTAFITFIALVTRALEAMGLNFYIPISKVDESLERAHKRDAVLNEKFYFRKNIQKPITPLNENLYVIFNETPSPANNSTSTSTSTPVEPHMKRFCCADDAFAPPTASRNIRSPPRSPTAADANHSKSNGNASSGGLFTTTTTAAAAASVDEDEIAEMTADEIINGSEQHSYVGLVPLIRQYLDLSGVKPETREFLERYITFISRKAKGELWTTARYLRHLVVSHPLYQQDSKLSDEIAYDIVRTVEKITNGELRPVELFGSSQ